MKRGIFYAFTGVKTVPGTILVTFVDIAKNVGLKISTVALMALIAMGAANCKGGDEIDPPTHMTQSEWEDLYDTSPRDGFHDDNGSTFDGTGYINGYDWKGWNKDGTYNKYTEQPWDPDGNKRNGEPYYDEQGFNPVSKMHENGTLYNKKYGETGYYNGVDYCGNLLPIASTGFDLCEDLNRSSVAGAMTYGHSLIFNRSSNLMLQFQHNANTENELKLKTSVERSHREFEMARAADKGDHIVQSAIQGASHYVDALIGLFPENERAEFELMLNTYRTKAYVDHRDRGKETSQASRELNGFYSQLGNDVSKSKHDTMASDISDRFTINKGMVESLLNCLVGIEKFYALVDEAKYIGIDPVKGEQGKGYTTEIGYRSLDSIRAILNDPNWIKAQ